MPPRSRIVYDGTETATVVLERQQLAAIVAERRRSWPEVCGQLNAISKVLDG